MARWAALVAGVLALVAAGCGAPGKPDPTRYTVLVTGFMRGQVADYGRRAGMGHLRARYFGGAGRMDTLLQTRRRRWRGEGRRVLTLDVGDFLSGSPEAAVTEGAVPAALMSARDYDAILVGNRELTFGQSRLYELARDEAGRARLPLVTSNVLVTTKAPSLFGVPAIARRAPGFARRRVELAAVPGEGWRPVAPDQAAGGARVEVLGFTPGNLAELVEADALAGLEVQPDLGWTLREVAPAGKAGPRLTVLLCQDDVIAKKAALSAAVAGTRVDLVIGHAYGKSARPYRVGDTWFVGIRNDLPGSALAEFHLEYDETRGRLGGLYDSYLVAKGGRSGVGYLAGTDGYSEGDRLDYDAPLPVWKPTRDVLAEYAAELEQLARPVATTKDDLWGAYEVESPLGNLVADLLRESAPGAQIAWVSAGVVGHHRIPRGPIQRRHLSWMFPYSNQLVRLTLPGAAIREALAGLVEDRVRILTSGMSYSHVAGAEPRLGLRVTVGGRDLDPEARYTLVTNSFHYRRNAVLRRFEVEELGDCRELIEARLRAKGEVRSVVEGRVLVLEPGRQAGARGANR